MISNTIVPLALMISLSLAMDLEVVAQTDSSYGKVYFMRLPKLERSSVSDGAAVSLLEGFLNYCNVFIDSNFICKLDEKKYFIVSVPPGMHQFDIQVRGKKIKVDSKPIAFNVEGGKSYFIQFEYRRYSGTRESYCKYLTEERANMMLPDLKEDKSCYKDVNQK